MTETTQIDSVPLSAPDLSQVPPRLEVGSHIVRLDNYTFHRSKSNPDNYYIAWQGEIEGGDLNGARVNGTFDGFFTMLNGRGASGIQDFLKAMGMNDDQIAKWDPNKGAKKLMGSTIGVVVKIEHDEEYGDRPKVRSYFSA